MMPISEIHIGDQYEDPFTRPYGLTFIVININKKEKMVQVQAVNASGKDIGKPFWKKNTDKMFNENWRVFTGWDEHIEIR